MEMKDNTLNKDYKVWNGFSDHKVHIHLYAQSNIVKPPPHPPPPKKTPTTPFHSLFWSTVKPPINPANRPPHVGNF